MPAVTLAKIMQLIQCHSQQEQRRNCFIPGPQNNDDTTKPNKCKRRVLVTHQPTFNGGKKQDEFSWLPSSANTQTLGAVL